MYLLRRSLVYISELHYDCGHGWPPQPIDTLRAQGTPEPSSTIQYPLYRVRTVKSQRSRYCQKTQEGAGQERGRERTPNAQASTDGPGPSDTHKHPGQISRPDHKTPQAKRDIAHGTSTRRDSHTPTQPAMPGPMPPARPPPRASTPPLWRSHMVCERKAAVAVLERPATRPEWPMSSSRDRRSRACAIAAAKPTCCRMSDTIHARASVTERDPSVRQWRCAADDADWPMRVPTSREPPPAVLP